MIDAGSWALLVLSLGLSAQSAFTIYLMLYTWWRPERLVTSRSPDDYEPPSRSFTALIPARHEKDVIAQTMRRVWAANYPTDLLEVVVICEHTDDETIREAERVIESIGHPNMRLAVFDDPPINKPHGLNVGFAESSHEVVTIVDAEDDLHPDIFLIVNTIMTRQRASIVQAGVQLMDFNSSWYAVHNVLEYFFWFKSRLHFHASVGMIPLGGNTVFMERRLLEEAGGWDEQCLTEDADIGIRLSTHGKHIAVTYDAEHTTREETPPTLAAFVRQRTRWNQGFLQVLMKGDWRHFPTLGQRILGFYTLTYPFVQAFMALLWPLCVVMMLASKVPVWIAMISFLPLYGLAFQLLMNIAGLLEFGATYGLRIGLREQLRLILGYLPYQAVLSLGALRGVYREIRGVNNWEKTAHVGAHRQAAPPVGAPPLSPRAALRRVA